MYRAESEDDECVQKNDELIPAESSPTECTSCEFVDKNLKNRKTYYYILEDIDLNGTATPRLIDLFSR